MKPIFHSAFIGMLLLFWATSAKSQPTGFLEHFSDEEGLQQSTIQGITQDEKGFIWLATFDGLVRFDGYEFNNYKLQAQKTLNLKSNRINFIKDDKYGRIWLKSNENEAYCYDTKRDEFWDLNLSDQLSGSYFAASSIKETPSGRIWLLSDTNGAICISDSAYHSYFFNQQRKTLKGSAVYNILEDQDQNTWLLTDNGLGFISSDNLQTVTFNFTNETNALQEKQSYYSALEMKDEIWFGGSNGQIWRYSKKAKAFYDYDLDTKSNIRNIIKLNDNEIVIVTSNEGFYVYNLSSGKRKHYQSANLNDISLNELVILQVESPNQIWFVTENVGIFKYDFSSETLSSFYNNKEEPVTTKYPQHPFVLKDGSGNLWIQPKGGFISYYDPQKDELQPFYRNDSPLESNVSVVIHSAFFDKQDNLWFYSSANLQKLTFYKNQFNKLHITESDNTIVPNYSMAENNVRSVFEDENRNTWIATRGSRLSIFNSKKEWVGYLSPTGKLDENAKWSSIIYGIMQDNNGNIWLGTKGSGLYKFTPTGEPYTFTSQHFTHNPEDKYSLNDNEIYSILQDKKNRIWIGTWGGGLNLVDDKSEEIRFLNEGNDLSSYPINENDQIRCIVEDDNGIIHLGTTNGLLSFAPDFDQPNTIKYHHYDNLIDNDVNCILFTSVGDIYLGTGGGIYYTNVIDSSGFPSQFKAYYKNNLSISGRILTILEDSKRNIWVASLKDLFCIYPENQSVETFSEVKRLISGHIFSEGSGCLLKNGEIILGYSDGIIHFNSSEVNINKFTPYLGLTNFEVFNQPTEDTNASTFKGSIDDASEIILLHNQNFFRINFVALDFSDGKNIKYKYKLEGLEDEWNYSGDQRTASYTMVPKGEYLFKISSTNGSGIWTDNERQLKVIVNPALWETNLAYAIYALLAIGLFVVIQKTILTIYRLRHNVKLQQRIAEMKLKFFTDISHEIRTPLTMVTMPVEHLVRDKKTPHFIKKQLQIVEQNGNRLLKLVNQILDLSKIQDKHLKVQKTELVGFVKKICNDFKELAVEKKIRLEFESNSAQADIWVDRECLDKMIINLLSNAFKYCPGGSIVKVILHQDEIYTSLKIIDNGPGISQDKQQKLFVRFSNFNEDPAKPSTGIGLSLVKEMADKHSATVTLESETGKGSAFTINFLNGYSHFDSDAELIISETPIIPAIEKTIEQDSENQKEISLNSKPVGLLVEDDNGLREYMKSVLEQDYQIYEAVDGAEGYQKAASLNPDFIVSDIMMPKKNGIELLKSLRDDVATSHIPIVLLTAKSDIQSKIEGLQFGADDYITKPFSLVYFKARIVNLLEQRKRLHQIYSSEIISDKEEDIPVISPKDKEFMEHLITYIQDHIDVNTLSVEDLAKVVGMSRTTFFSKVKSLTGKSPVEFVRDLRLKHAARLILTEQLLVKEACYASGFSDLKYFGKCFKEKYKLTPAEYRKGMKAS